MREAVLFDVSAADGDDDITLAGKRVAQFTYGPWAMGATHLVIGVAILLHCAFTGAATGAILASLLPLALALLLDAAAAAMLIYRRKLSLSPHFVGQLTVGYVLASGALWMLFAVASKSVGAPGSASVLALALGAGVAMKGMMSIGSPPVAIANSLIAAIGATLFTHGGIVPGVVTALGLVTIVYSIAVTRMMIAIARRRLQLDWSAQKSLNFVAEFEASGRGWFWETNAAGTLSYVSQQLADDFKTDPAAMLGLQFTDLMSVDSAPGEEFRDERTLGFHLSARFPFSDVVVRPASDADVHWSLSGNPVFDDHGRYLGFRGIGTDLTEQRRSEQEISRLARFDSLTGLPNRAMMRQTLDEALRNAARRQRGCSLFLIDLDRFKNVNDTLGHPIGDLLL